MSYRSAYQQPDCHLAPAAAEVLPIIAVVHCAVGVWMHTYYRGSLSGKAAAALASGMTSFDSASSR